jgi:hypothetical protein
MAKKVPTLNIIKPVLGTSGVSDADFISRLNAVHDGMNNNAAYPSPPIDMAGFKAAIDAYSAAVAAALDGGKSAITARDKRRADVTIMFRLLGHYVEVACKNDMNTFVSSGFVAVAKHAKTPAQPVAVPAIGAVDQGSNSGQLVVTIKSVPKARSYDLRYAPVPAAGAAITYTTVALATAKPAVTINNLTPGTTYTFQVRAFGKLGFSDWSDGVNRMCT